MKPFFPCSSAAAAAMALSLCSSTVLVDAFAPTTTTTPFLSMKSDRFTGPTDAAATHCRRCHATASQTFRLWTYQGFGFNNATTDTAVESNDLIMELQGTSVDGYWMKLTMWRRSAHSLYIYSCTYQRCHRRATGRIPYPQEIAVRHRQCQLPRFGASHPGRLVVGRTPVGGHGSR